MAREKALSRNASFELNAVEFLMSGRLLTLAQKGAEFKRVCEAVASGDRSFDGIKPSYVGRIYWRPNTQRPGIPKATREAVFDAAGRKCVTCGRAVPLTIDHKIAWSKGGTDAIENLQAMCFPCNRRKGAN